MSIKQNEQGDLRTWIYHLVTEKDFLAQAKNEQYLPAGFKDFGFVHCALEASVVAVANAYYAQVEEKLILLKIDPQKLHSETKYESAVPEAAAGSEHLKTSTMFPHVYGPIDQIAIEGIGILAKENNGYRWPIEFVPLSEYLH